MTVRSKVRGNSPDIALIHGWGACAAVWDEFAAGLTPHIRARSIDLAGYGASATRAPYTLDTLSDAVMDELPASVTLCGWSLGGQVAINCALRNPRRIARVVLVATTPRFTRAAGWNFAIDSALLEEFDHDLRRDCKATLRRFISLQAQGDVDSRTVARRLRARIETGDLPDRAALHGGLAILKETDLRASLPQVGQPVLLLHGNRDSIVPLAAAKFMQRALARARLEVLSGAAHAPFVTHAARVSRCIAEFCNER